VTRRRTIGTLCAAVLLVTASTAPSRAAVPSTSAPTSRFGGEQTVVAVEIPVQVLSDGVPVRGLGKDDFEVLEGRRGQPIVDFEVVDLSIARTAGGRAVAVDPTVVAAGRRHFLLLFDLTNSSPVAISRAREAARNLVQGSLHPTDLVSVATWSFTKGPKLLIGFTSDRRQVQAAIDTLGVVELRNRALDPLALVISTASDAFGTGTSGEGAGRNTVGSDEFLESMQNFATYERAAARRDKNDELAALTAGWGGVAHMLANVLGRKYVVLLSQGFDTQTITGSTDASVQEETNLAIEAGEVWKVNSEERFGSTRSVRRLEDMLEEFRRADCSIQSVDIGGLSTGVDATDLARGSGRESLATLAQDTGGNLYENFNDLGQAMEKMLAATSVTYVLTIEPPNLALDGKFHDIKVRLKNGRSGMRLVHRSGYYAPTPFTARSAGEKQLDSGQLILSGRPGGDLRGGVVASVFPGDGWKAHVPVVVELDGSQLLEVLDQPQAPLSFYLYAIDDFGQIRDFITQDVRLDVGQVRDHLQGEELKFVADLRLEPGRFALRSLVRAGVAGAYFLDHHTLVVPRFGESEIVVGPPVFPQAMTEGVVVRSSSSADRTKGLPYPFTLANDFFLPDGLPHLPAGGAIRACVDAYGLDASAVDVAGELVDAAGEVVPGARVRLLRRLDEHRGLERFELQVDVGAEVPAGDYSLRIALAQNGRSTSSTAALSVVR